MKTLTLESEDILDQFMGVLDMDIQQLEKNIAVLDQLRCLVVKQDNDGLSQLLNKIQSEVKGHHENGLKRLALRKELAFSYGCDIEQLTLSRLETVLPGQKKLQVSQRKIKLQTLSARLKKEYENTQRLLSDCARFNRLLLKSIFNLGRSEATTYNAAGSTRRQMNAVFMDTRL